MLLLIVSLIVITLLWNNHVCKATENNNYSIIDSIPSTRTGLLLGTSRLLRNGNQNAYFENRIRAATELYKAGKIEILIVSGDNGSTNYDEPTDMKNALMGNGVDSSDIILDYAGFRTFDSVIRLKEIFDQRKAIVISQKFHNERAIYIGRNNSIELYGYNAADVNKYYGFKTNLRELFARNKMALDIFFGIEPKYLGPKVVIP